MSDSNGYIEQARPRSSDLNVIVLPAYSVFLTRAALAIIPFFQIDHFLCDATRRSGGHNFNRNCRKICKSDFQFEGNGDTVTVLVFNFFMNLAEMRPVKESGGSKSACDAQIYSKALSNIARDKNG